MKYFVINSKNLGELSKAVQAANEEGIDYTLNQGSMRIWVSEFEAYRTGFKVIKKYLRPRKLWIRSWFFHFDSNGIPRDLSLFSAGTKECLDSINKGYRGGHKIYGLLSDTIYTCGDYRITYDNPGRTPYISYHPIYSGKNVKDISAPVSEYIQSIPKAFLGSQANLKELILLQKRIRDLVKC